MEALQMQTFVQKRNRQIHSLRIKEGKIREKKMERERFSKPQIPP